MALIALVESLSIDASPAERIAAIHPFPQTLAGCPLGIGQMWLGLDGQQAGNGLAATGDDDLGTLLDLLQVTGKMLIGVTDGDDFAH
jgi:hypothetical protein